MMIYLKRTLELHKMILVFRAVFHVNNKYYPQVLLDEFLHKRYMLEKNRIDVSKGIDVNKTDGSPECIICH